ncbi:MAG: hypothetical protein J6037_05775 [Bacteroidales bacterium]|nr:hypothetical protein [Bacteroidales bacterium]
MNSILIDISGVFEQEEFSSLPCVDLRSLEGTNCYCSPDAAEVIKRELSIIPLSTVCWIDTGDYHYLSYFRGLLIPEPFELVLLDNHTDDFDLSDTLSCGNWVTALRRDSKMAGQAGYDVSSHPRPDRGSLPIFLSIDLDILSPSEFRTNWDQGTMTFDELLVTIRNIAATRRIIAIDICGGLTESKGAMSCELDLNRRQRQRLLELLSSLSSPTCSGI